MVTGRNFLEKNRDVGGIVLQIAVHGDDVLAACVIETGGQSSGLAEITAEFDHGNPAIHSGNLAQHGECVVAGAVIHQHDFECLARRLHHRFQTVVQIGDVLLLIVQRDDDGVFGHSLFIIARNQFSVLSSQFSVGYPWGFAEN